MPSQAALLIGDIVHARAEWEALSTLVTLKVQFYTGRSQWRVIRL